MDGARGQASVWAAKRTSANRRNVRHSDWPGVILRIQARTGAELVHGVTIRGPVIIPPGPTRATPPRGAASPARATRTRRDQARGWVPEQPRPFTRDPRVQSRRDPHMTELH